MNQYLLKTKIFAIATICLFGFLSIEAQDTRKTLIVINGDTIKNEVSTNCSGKGEKKIIIEKNIKYDGDKKDLNIERIIEEELAKNPCPHLNDSSKKCIKKCILIQSEKGCDMSKEMCKEMKQNCSKSQCEKMKKNNCEIKKICVKDKDGKKVCIVVKNGPKNEKCELKCALKCPLIGTDSCPLTKCPKMKKCVMINKDGEKVCIMIDRTDCKYDNDCKENKIRSLSNQETKELKQLLSKKQIEIGSDKFQKASLYPNPTSGVFEIILPKVDIISPIAIKIIDVEGKVVYEIEKTVKENAYRHTIELTQPNGIYYVYATNGKNQFAGKIEVKK